MPYLFFVFVFFYLLEEWMCPSLGCGHCILEEKQNVHVKCSSAIFRGNICLALAVLKHSIVLAVVLRDWYNLSSSKPLLEMFYFGQHMIKEKGEEKKTSKLMSPRRNQFILFYFFSWREAVVFGWLGSPEKLCFSMKETCSLLRKK